MIDKNTENLVKMIIRNKGGYREKNILKHAVSFEKGQWDKEHKVVRVVSIDKHCEIDIQTGRIVG